MVAPVYQVIETGDQQYLGRAWFCPHSPGMDYCEKVYRLGKKIPVWPEDLLDEHFRAITNRGGPGHWFSYGYHLMRADDGWINMRENNYLPLEEWSETLCDRARRLIGWRARYSGEEAIQRLLGVKWQ